MNLACPQCGNRMMVDFKTDRVKCPHCGYIRPDDIGGLEAKEREVKAHGSAPAVQLIYKGEIKGDAMAAFDSGQDALFKGNKQEALNCFQRAADYMPDWPDAHLWIARVSDDEKVKRDELGIVLGLAPNNLEAIRLIMVMDGKLTPEQAAQTVHDNDPRVQQPPDGVAAKAASLICPKCGGDLTVNQLLNRVECRFCGYVAPLPKHASIDGTLLSMALLERKAKPVTWNVGKRIVKCQQCGAEHTIPAGQMSQRCRFCGSTEVIVSDDFGSFTQPELLLPFVFDEARARENIDQALRGLGERLMALFKSNKVDREIVEGVYLPFWVFDAVIEVTRVKSVGGVEEDRSTTTDGQFDVEVCAVKSPPQDLTGQLTPYDLRAAIQYDPHWLAKYPAQMYSVDFDAASLDARAVIADSMQKKYALRVEERLLDMGQDRNNTASMQVYSQVQSMTFRLALLPVWIATLYGAEGETRLAVVNAQTGKTALGRPTAK